MFLAPTAYRYWRCFAPLRSPKRQVKEVVANLTAKDSPALEGGINEDEIAEFIKDVSHHDAGPENVKRVAATLAAAGWPLTGVTEATVSD